jgi:peptide/nickel transport system ATP-binding protein
MSGSVRLTKGSPVLQIDDLSVSYRTENGRVHAVSHVSLRVAPQESYGLVGESGSGKTTLALAVMNYLDVNGQIMDGRILLGGEDLIGKSEGEFRKIWGSRMGMVYQNPGAALNPSIVIGEQIAEVARIHLGLSRAEAWSKAIDMLRQVRMPDPEAVAKRYPHQLSGGMQQRAVIAMALCSNPTLLILDEPTTNLDVTTEAVILDLLMEIKNKYESALLYITHNLAVVARICNRVGVIYAGELVEEGSVKELYKQPLHPYTMALLGCIPRLGRGKRDGALRVIPGRIPPLDQLPLGCIFAPRCPLAHDRCYEEKPTLVEAQPSRWTKCLFWQLLRDRKVTVEEGTLSPHEGTMDRLFQEPLVSVSDLRKYYSLAMLGRGKRTVRAVDGISLDLPQRYTVGLVGESGCGKTTFARCLMGFIKPSDGKIELGGISIAGRIEERSQEVRKRLQMVFQNPEVSLNPYHTVYHILQRPLRLLRGLEGKASTEWVSKLLKFVNLDDSYASRFPRELSGGEKQRVAIARALAAEPDLVVLDEPISSLDVSVQASVLNLLTELQDSMGISYLFISHDLAVVRYLCDAIAVVYLGEICEIGPSEAIFRPPYHPYTEALLSAIPIADPRASQERIRLSGAVPSAIDVPTGCRFHPRCPRKVGTVCETDEPPWLEDAPFHRIRCHIALEELRSLPDVLR